MAEAIHEAATCSILMIMELREVCELIVDCEHKTAPTQKAGYPSIRTPNIGRGYLILDGVNRVSEETYRLWTRRAVPKAGDLIMAREAPVGNVAIIPAGIQPCLGQRTLLIRTDRSKADPAYLTYLLLGEEVQATIYGLTNGVTVPHLNMEDVRTLPIPLLPAVPVQRRIAGVLSAFDELIENNQRRIQILEAMARALYREWFVELRFPGHEKIPRVASSLGEVPQGWEVVSLDDACELLTDGSHSSPRSVEEGLPMASSKDMHDWGLTLDTCRFIERHDFERLVRNGCKPKKNDILITKDGANYLKHIFVNRAEQELVLLSSIAILRPNARINPHLLAAILKSPENKARLKNYVTGAAIPRIVLKDFKQFQFVLPSASVQRQWAVVAEPLTELCWRLIDQIQNLRRTRDLLLPHLLSGQVTLTPA